MDLLSMLKLANIFGAGGIGPAPYDPSNPTGFSGEKMFPPGGSTGQTFPAGFTGGMDMPSQGGITGTMPRDGSTGMDLNTAIQQLLNPQDTQFKSFSDLINQMPQRSQYQPSKFRQVAAAIAGMGTGSPVGIANGQVVGFKSNIPEGLKVQQAIKDEPYNQALTDWANKLDPTSKIAQMEANRNVNLRQIGLGEMARQTANKRADIAQQKADQDAEYQRGRLSMQQQRIDFNKYKQANPNSIFKIDADGDMIALNPQTNKSEKVLDQEGNPVKSATLTDAEKLQLQEENKIKEITATGEQSRLTETLRQAGRKELEGQKAVDRLDLKKTPAPAKSSTEKPLTPSAERTANQNKAVAIINEHPELQKYFEVGGNKLPTGQLIAPKDPNDAGYQIAQRLMGKSADIKLPSDINPKVNIESSVPSRELTRLEDPRIKAARAKVESGYVLITDGKSFGQVKPEDTAKLPKGWMVVK